MARSQRSRAGDPPAAGAARAAWGTISREQVIDAAVAAVRAGNAESVTIRGLARDLGVAPMSLYRHVNSKDDLLDEVVGRLLDEVWRPEVDESQWRTWLAVASDNLRQFLVDQPIALHIYLKHPVVSPAAVERMEAAMRVLRGVVADEEQARHAYAALQTYTIGFAALEAARSRSGWQPQPEAAGELARQLAAHTTRRSFAEGLDYLVDGIQRRGTAAG